MPYRVLFTLVGLLWIIPVALAAEEITALKLTGVQFKGAKQVDRKALSKTLSAQMPGRFKFWVPKPVLTQDDLADDSRKIKQYYQAHGFFNVAVEFSLDQVKALSSKTNNKSGQVTAGFSSPPPSHSAKVIFLITEGQPVRVESIVIQVKHSPAVFSESDIFSKLPLKENARFEIANYKESKIIIQKYAGNRGYPFAKVTSKARVNTETHSATIAYEIDAGPPCTFGSLKVATGDIPIKKAIVERALTFKPGEPYETRKVEQSQRNLYNLDVFKSAQIRNEDGVPGDPAIPMTLTLKAKKRQSVKLGIGYGSEDGLRLKGGWIYRNPYGWAGRVSVDAKRSDLYEGISGEYTQPYFWNANTSLSTGLGTEKQMLDSYDSLHTYGNLNLTRKWGSHWQLFAGYCLDMSRLDDLNLTDPEELVEYQREKDYLISSGLVGALWNNTDSDINPTRGRVFSIMLETASSLFGSDISFLSPELEIKTYQSWPFQTLLACRFKAQSILEIEDTDYIPIFKRLFLGGSNTVRGYRYQNLGPLDENGNPLGGQTALNANVELRRRLFKLVSGVLFLDMGLLKNDAFDFDLSDMKFGSGAGIRYDTPVGPIRIDVGYKLNPETSMEDRWRIHFSIGHAF